MAQAARSLSLAVWELGCHAAEVQVAVRICRLQTYLGPGAPAQPDQIIVHAHSVALTRQPSCGRRLLLSMCSSLNAEHSKSRVRRPRRELDHGARVRAAARAGRPAANIFARAHELSARATSL